MSGMDDMLRMTADEVSNGPGTSPNEDHIVIGRDRVITIPDCLKEIAVQRDHNVESVTFDCPRYWDGVDFTEGHTAYIAYMRADGETGTSLATAIIPDVEDDSICHFTWSIKNHATAVMGALSILVCIKAVDEDGNELRHWNSRLNKEDLYISEGLSCGISGLDKTDKDIITELVSKMNAIEKLPPAVQVTETSTGYTIVLTDVNNEYTIHLKHGEKGDKGDKGDTGDDGADGKDGVNGRDGADGKDGVNGRDGGIYTPSVSEDGVMSWSNDVGAENPKDVHIASLDVANALHVNGLDIQQLPDGTISVFGNDGIYLMNWVRCIFSGQVGNGTDKEDIKKIINEEIQIYPETSESRTRPGDRYMIHGYIGNCSTIPTLKYGRNLGFILEDNGDMDELVSSPVYLNDNEYLVCMAEGTSTKKFKVTGIYHYAITIDSDGTMKCTKTLINDYSIYFVYELKGPRLYESNNVLFPLQAPVITVVNDDLIIADPSGQAEEFDIYVDGEVIKTVTADETEV